MFDCIFGITILAACPASSFSLLGFDGFATAGAAALVFLPLGGGIIVFSPVNTTFKLY